MNRRSREWSPVRRFGSAASAASAADERGVHEAATKADLGDEASEGKGCGCAARSRAARLRAGSLRGSRGERVRTSARRSRNRLLRPFRLLDRPSWRLRGFGYRADDDRPKAARERSATNAPVRAAKPQPTPSSTSSPRPAFVATSWVRLPGRRRPARERSARARARAHASRRARRGTAAHPRTADLRAAPSSPTARPSRGCHARARSSLPTGAPSAGSPATGYPSA